MRDFILIDFSWLYNKYYYVAKFNNSESELPVHPTLLRMLKEFLLLVHRNYPEAKFLIALDSPTSTLKNFKICKDYKQNRNKEEKEEVYKPLDFIVRSLVKLLNPKVFSFIRAKLYESDQILAFIAKKYHENHRVIIFSGDKDFCQLTYYPNVFLSDKFEKGHFIFKTDKDIFEKFKNNKGEDFTRISTNKRDLLKYRVLKGDTSDNLKPVFPRIKDKEIASIIKEYWIDEEELTEERINDILDDLRHDNKNLAEKLEASKETWLQNYKIMNLIDIEDIELVRLK